MKIRAINVEDLNKMCEIEKENFTDPWDFKILFFEVIKNDKSVFFGAYIDEVLVGYIGFWCFDDNIDIINLAVLDEYKRQGIASKLFDSLLIYANFLKPKTITLEVNVNNENAVQLYKKLGFITLRVIKNYYSKTNEDAYLMQKEVYYG